MRRVGLRALKWPLSKGETETAVANLERCEDTVVLGSQIGQTYVFRGFQVDVAKKLTRLMTILFDIDKGIEGISFRAVESASAFHIPRSTIPFPPDPDFVDRPGIRSGSQNNILVPLAVLRSSVLADLAMSLPKQ